MAEKKEDFEFDYDEGSQTLYYYDERPYLNDETTKQQKITPFQQQVYNATRLIPPGYVATYNVIANTINCKSNQAIGQALKKNPFPLTKTNDLNIMVPCHRVIASNYNIGGFNGCIKGNEILNKINLLKNEGIQFTLMENKIKSKIHNYQLEKNDHSKVLKFIKKQNKWNEYSDYSSTLISPRVVGISNLPLIGDRPSLINFTNTTIVSPGGVQ